MQEGNILICNNCNEPNALYSHTCSNCKAFLRPRISNIDFGKAILGLIEDPQTQFNKLIQADHKNFSLFFSFLFATKVFLLFFLIENVFNQNPLVINYLFYNFLMVVCLTYILISIISVVLKSALKLKNIQTRFKDNFTILSYAFFPISFSVIIFLPLEYAAFGFRIFDFDPSPFRTTSFSAYIFVSLEGLMLIWTLMLSYLAIFVQSRSYMFSIIFTLGIFGTIFLILILIPLLPF